MRSTFWGIASRALRGQRDRALHGGLASVRHDNKGTNTSHGGTNRRHDSSGTTKHGGIDDGQTTA
eukprot:438090-Prorocentrum_lima.AAC.1